IRSWCRAPRLPISPCSPASRSTSRRRSRTVPWWRSIRPASGRSFGSLDDLFRLVVGLAVAAQRRRPGAGIELLQARRNLGVLALEQVVAGKIALDQERAELLDVEHPDRLRQAELLEPVDAWHPLDAAPEQRAGAVADGGQIDRLVGHERVAIHLRGHSAFAD